MVLLGSKYAILEIKKYRMMVLLVCLAAAGVFFAYAPLKNVYDLWRVDQWIRNHPVNAMILKDHPETYDLFVGLFLPAQRRDGEAGLRNAQIEMQIIANVNYIADHVWDYDHVAVRRYVQAEFRLYDDLIDKTGDNGLCEKYRVTSAYFNEVRAAVGDETFLKYIKASEALFLSARDNRPFLIRPGMTNYKDFLDKAVSEYHRRTQIDWELSGLKSLQYMVHDRNSVCKQVIIANYSMLRMGSFSMSLLWRDNLEKWRLEKAGTKP
jgi:hypothetical protein